MGALFLSKLRKYKKVRGQTVYLLFLWYIYPFCCSTEYALPGLTAEYGGTVLLTVCTVFSLFRREIRRFNGADVLFLLRVLRGWVWRQALSGWSCFPLGAEQFGKIFVVGIRVCPCFCPDVRL